MADNRAEQERQLAEAKRQQEELATFLAKAGVNFAKRNKKLTGLWVLGLAIMAFVSGFSVSQEKQAAYDSIVSEIDDERAYNAESNVYDAQRKYYQSKGWFSCDNRCYKNYERLQQAERRLARVRAEDAAILRSAKQQVGLLSTHGVQETRDLFWSTFAKGKGFAKRASWWDMIFIGIGSMGRDENMLGFLLRWLIQVLMNFTMGMIGALVAFVWYLWDIVSSYGASLSVSFVFFTLAVASFLVAFYAAAAGSVYVVAKAAGPGGIRIGDRNRQRQAYLRQQGAYGQGFGGPGLRRRHMY